MDASCTPEVDGNILQSPAAMTRKRPLEVHHNDLRAPRDRSLIALLNTDTERPKEDETR